MIAEPSRAGNNVDGSASCGIPVDADISFANHRGVYKRAIEKRQRNLLKKIPFITTFLDADEKILQVTTGCSPAPLIEQFLTGWIIFYLKRCLFVFTNKRIFHIPTRQNFSYRYSIAQILYADCESMALKGHTLVAKYKNGKAEKFLCIAPREKKKIRTLLKDMPLQGQSSPALQRTHLCPRCTSLLIENQYVCPNCSLEFKNTKKARKVSLLYPGGGYFYTGHPFLGLADVFVETYLSLLLILTLSDVLTGYAESFFPLVFLGAILAVEKALTVYHSNNFIKEYIPGNSRIVVHTKKSASLANSDASEKPTPEAVLAVR
ncbi:MAG: hypothetical protein ACYS76_12560 [Planctomycetota bacterium]